MASGTIREGSLEAPTRHPLDWKSADFWDEAKLQAELERTFEICHGCRRCVSLCGAFPALFDLIDEGPTGELDGVPKERFKDVVDQCYLCDMCYMSKCPYVPPHEWNLDFPHLMLRAKAVERRTNGPKLRDTILSSTDKTGMFAGIPVVTQIVNAVNRTPPMRKALEATLGVDAKAWLPEFATTKFRTAAGTATHSEVRDGERTPGKVALFSTCFINYNEPGIGHDLVAILEHNGIPWVLAEKESCCGMPKLEQGDLDGVEALKNVNIPQLLKLARAGYAILTGVPSCTLMFKQELPLMFPNDADVLAVRDAMWEPFEYLVARLKDGLLKTDFTKGLGKVSYHVPCHGRVQNIGRKTEEFLKKIPDSQIATTERCSGHAGTFGVKKEFHAMAMKIGKPVFRMMAGTEPDIISSDCPLGGHHLSQGISEQQGKNPELVHPISLVRRAYGI
ncbi:MAG: Fe-S oxidoreductase [Rhodocyclaceae bacterium]|nr:Fe-S oxidoreductase [Rhodocyclaceae bacterium]MCP5231688.1 Fe-S oxidoreductase [Zoogloeaceae bacterium]MCB1913479.1 Fe-S oxidoreductase [Rhodocyclaceae bacterium]MCP5239971.1 Fe-S oxidoreductase [Zoogloeaceae bacterium]MCP5253800.1 Fe-S oxidoreductase [Zoogloeaceae bacterium]